MGLFEVQVKLANPATRAVVRDVALLVDTGATLSWIPREILRSLGVTPTSRLEFQLADGRVLEREVGAALFTIDGRTLAIPVAFGESGEQPVLGATTLEALGFAVDPVERRLVSRRLLALWTCRKSERERNPPRNAGTATARGVQPLGRGWPQRRDGAGPPPLILLSEGLLALW